MKIALVLCFFFSLPLLLAQNSKIKPKNAPPQTPATDAAAGSLRPYKIGKAPYKGVQKQSLYLTMRDGVKLAIDIYLPKNLEKTAKIPALVRQTRYWRAPQLRFPFSLFSNGLLGRTGQMISEIVQQGYAIVNVDVRGSGASFGTQHYPWNPDEVQDGYEILDWIVKQPWCNGNIGSIGVSYDGTAAEFLASTGHPNLKAVVLMFSLFDVYDDNAFPGGIHHVWFTESWGEANARMDANKLPSNYQKLKALVKGVSKVQTKKSKKILKQAIASHSDNLNVHDAAISIDCRNDLPLNPKMPMVDQFSPHRIVQKIGQSNVAVYSYTGWHDGGYQHAAIKRHLNLPQGKGHKLMLGPWEHGGKFNVSPFTYNKAAFNHKAEILKFFDYHLKGIQNGLYDEPPIHYFTFGSEQWQGSQTWPPTGLENQTFYLSPSQQLQTQQSQTDQTDSLWVDNSFGSGDLTRWKALNGKVTQPYTYHDWTQRSQNLLHYQTPPLESDMEMTGHPIITLYTSFSDCDASVFVYLEEVLPSGRVIHITEGQLKASHRKLSTTPLYADVVPMRSHNWQDEQTVTPDDLIELQFDLLPMSYTFKKGSRLRISISGADKDHFEILHPEGYELNIHHGKQHPSRIVLPLKVR